MKFDVRDFSMAGAFVGLVLFILFGLTPTVAYGDMTTTTVTGVHSSTIIPVSICVAIVLLLSIAGAFTALGASIGALFGTVQQKLKQRH